MENVANSAVLSKSSVPRKNPPHFGHRTTRSPQPQKAIKRSMCRECDPERVLRAAQSWATEPPMDMDSRE